MTEKLSEAQAFSGRLWVFEELNSWLASAEKARYFLLRGEPGSGKSAIARQLVRYSDNEAAAPAGLGMLVPGFLAASHFCSARDGLSIDGRQLAENFSGQLARVPEYLQELGNAGEPGGERHIRASVGTVRDSASVTFFGTLNLAGLTPRSAFNRLIVEPLSRMGEDGYAQPLILLVDGLDEALAWEGETIVDLLARLEGLPDFARFILTSRNEAQILAKFIQAPGLNLSDTRFDLKNYGDLGNYIRLREEREPLLKQKLATAWENRGGQAAWLEHLARKALGNFLYVEWVLDAIAADRQTPDELEQLPAGLDYLVYQSLERVVELGQKPWDRVYQPVLGVLAASQEALGIDQLLAFTRMDEPGLYQALDDLAQFYDLQSGKVQAGSGPPEHTALGAELGEARYRLYHESLADFLQKRQVTRIDAKTGQAVGSINNKFVTPLATWHTAIVEAYKGDSQAWSEVAWEHVDAYGLRFLPRHIGEVTPSGKRVAALEALFSDSYLKERLGRTSSPGQIAGDVDGWLQASQMEHAADVFPLLKPGQIYATLADLAASLPPEVAAVWAGLGQPERALELANGYTDPQKRREALVALAEAVIQTEQNGAGLAGVEGGKLAHWLLTALEQDRDNLDPETLGDDSLRRLEDYLAVLRVRTGRLEASSMMLDAAEDWNRRWLTRTLAAVSVYTGSWQASLKLLKGLDSFEQVDILAEALAAAIHVPSNPPVQELLAAVDDPNVRADAIGKAIPLLYQRGNQDLADILFKEAQAGRPEETLEEAALQLARAGFIEEGLALVQAYGDRLSPERIVAEGLSVRAARLGWPAALESEILPDEPDRSTVIRNVIENLLGQGGIDQAQDLIAQVQAPEARDASRRSLVEALARRGQQSRLEEELSKFLADEQREEALISACDILAGRGRLEEALDLASRLQENGRRRSAFGELLRHQFIQAGWDSLPSWLAGLPSPQDAEQAVSQLVQLWLFDERAVLAERALGLLPASEELNWRRAELARAWQRRGEFEKAWGIAEQVSQRGTREDAFERLLRAEIMAGNVDAALERLDQIDDARAKTQILSCAALAGLREQRQLEAAVEIARQALRLALSLSEEHAQLRALAAAAEALALSAVETAKAEALAAGRQTYAELESAEGLSDHNTGEMARLLAWSGYAREALPLAARIDRRDLRAGAYAEICTALAVLAQDDESQGRPTGAGHPYQDLFEEGLDQLQALMEAHAEEHWVINCFIQIGQGLARAGEVGRALALLGRLVNPRDQSYAMERALMKQAERQGFTAALQSALGLPDHDLRTAVLEGLAKAAAEARRFQSALEIANHIPIVEPRLYASARILRNLVWVQGAQSGLTGLSNSTEAERADLLRRLVENLSDSGDSLAAMQIASQADVNRPDLQAIVLGRTFGSQSKEEQAALLSMVRPEDLDEVIQLTLWNIFIWSSESAAYQLVQSLGDGSGADHAWSELSSHLLRHGTPETALESALRISNSERREAGVADAVVASIAAGQNADSLMGSLADRLEPFELQGVLRKTVDELAWRARSGKASDRRLAAEAPALVARLSDPQEADRARRRLIPAAALIGDRLTLEALLAAVEDPWYRDFGLAEAVELLADAGALEPARELAGRIERRTERNRALASFSRRALRQPGPEGAALARTALEEITRQMPADIQDEIWETLALFEFTLGLAGLGELEEAESVVGQLDRRSWHRSDGLIELARRHLIAGAPGQARRLLEAATSGLLSIRNEADRIATGIWAAEVALMLGGLEASRQVWEMVTASLTDAAGRPYALADFAVRLADPQEDPGKRRAYTGWQLRMKRWLGLIPRRRAALEAAQQSEGYLQETLELRAADVWSILAGAYWLAGEQEQALRAGDRGLELLAGQPAEVWFGKCLGRIFRVAWLTRRMELAERTLAQVFKAAHTLPEQDDWQIDSPKLELLKDAAVQAARAGGWEALERLEDAIQAIDLPPKRTAAFAAIARALADAGHQEAARTRIQRLIAQSEGIDQANGKESGVRFNGIEKQAASAWEPDGTIEVQVALRAALEASLVIDDPALARRALNSAGKCTDPQIAKELQIEQGAVLSQRLFRQRLGLAFPPQGLSPAATLELAQAFIPMLESLPEADDEMSARRHTITAVLEAAVNQADARARLAKGLLIGSRMGRKAFFNAAGDIGRAYTILGDAAALKHVANSLAEADRWWRPE